jgi:hypothetical protein
MVTVKEFVQIVLGIIVAHIAVTINEAKKLSIWTSKQLRKGSPALIAARKTFRSMIQGPGDGGIST